MTDTERLLSDALRARADHASYRPTPMADVVGTARVLRRRRRRTTALAVAAAVVAVTVPVAVALGPDGATGPGPSDRTSSGPTSARPRTPLEDLPRGPAPRVAYAEDGEFVSVGGTRTRVPIKGGISAITPYHGGFLVADDLSFEDTVGLHLLAGDGTVQGSWCSAGSPVVSGDQMLTAWVTMDCSTGDITSTVIHRGVSNGMGEGEASQVLDRPAQLVGEVGGEVVYTGLHGDGSWVTDLQHPPRRLPDLARAWTVDPATGLVGGAASNKVGVLVDPSSGVVLRRLPGWLPVSFSPDGRYFAAVQTTGTRNVSLFDTSTGKEVQQVFRDLGGAVLQVAWEDDTHLLGSVWDRARERVALVRSDLAGRLELATPLHRATDLVFAAHP